ncbi:MAG: hypothetical protein J6Y14_11185 [Fibrobacter sp.]|nr:hypothetical protein [Fibrobacter sp.]
MDELLTWRKLRNELEDMLKARSMSYPDAVKEYYLNNPKSKFNTDNFDYKNSVEKKYWKRRPKHGETPDDDKLIGKNASRYPKAIEFFTQLKDYLITLDCPKSEQWIVENMGSDFFSRFSNGVIQPLKREAENHQSDCSTEKDCTDELLTWRRLRNELDDMFEAYKIKFQKKSYNYRDAVIDFYKAHPKDLSEKKLKRKNDIKLNLNGKDPIANDFFDFESSVEKKYWRNRPKSDEDLSNDRLGANNKCKTEDKAKYFKTIKSRYSKAIEFFKELKNFIASQNRIKPDEWIIENMGKDFYRTFRSEVIQPVKKEIEERKFKPSKDLNGMDEFDF